MANNTALAEYTIQYDLSGVDDPTVVPTEAVYGSTYRLLKLGEPKFFLKLDDGKTTNWKALISEPAGINLGTGAQVLKTVEDAVMQFRTLKAVGGVTITQKPTEIEIAVPVGADPYQVEYFEITALQAAAKQIILSTTPTKPLKTLVDIASGGGMLRYTLDFTVASDVLSWSGGRYDGLIAEGDELRVVYF